MAKFIQLFRNQLDAVFADKLTAKAALQSNNIDPQVLKDGMPILARYYTDGPNSAIKTLLGIAHNDGASAVVTVFDSGSIDELDSNVSAATNYYFDKIVITDGKLDSSETTTKKIDTAQIVDYVENTSSATSGTNLETTDTIAEALAKVEQRVDIETAAREAAIQGLDYTGVTNEATKVVTDVTETDGIIAASATSVENLVIATAPTTADSKVAANDTIGTAFGKLQGQIDSMDLTTVSGEGQPIIAVAQADGKVTATAGTIAASAVTVSDATYTFSGDTVQDALEDLYAKSAANVISSPDSSITITTASTGTSIDVNVDDTTIVIDGTNGKVKSNLSIEKLTDSLPTNVKERYILRYGTNTDAIGDAIDIYKDSSLSRVYLGHVDDEINETTGAQTVTGTGDTALCFVYYTVNGTYTLAAVNVETFLEESEFADGLQVNNHVVSVKVDSTSEKVTTSEGSVPVLSVSSSGTKVSNIQNAIDYAISTLDADVTGNDTNGFVTVQVEEADGVISAVTVTTSGIASAQDLTDEIAARKAVDGQSGQTYEVNSNVEYIGNVDSLNAADVALDTALAALSAKTVTEVAMTGGTAAIAAANDGTKKITINTDGSQITLSGYTSGTAQADITTASTVNQAIGQLEYRIAEGTSGLQDEVDAIETAVGLASGGTHVQSTGHYTSGASTIEGEIVALDTKVSGVANTYLSSAVTGNNGVTVEVSAAAESGTTATVGLKLDTATTSTTTTAQATTGASNALQITSGDNGGLYLDSSWDCGFYSVQNNG